MEKEKIEKMKNQLKICKKSELEDLKLLIDAILEEMQLAERGNLLDNIY